MEIATGATCKFVMNSNVEINFIQKKMKKEEEKMDPWNTAEKQ